MNDAANLFTIFICDDNERFLETLGDAVDEAMKDEGMEYQTRKFSNPNMLLMSDTKEADVLFLDIEMPEYNGMILAQTLHIQFPELIIIFVTNYMEFMPEAFKVRAFRYLVKPIQQAELREALHGAIDEYIQNHAVQVAPEDAKREERIRVRSIVFVEVLRHNLLFHLENGRELQQRMTLKQLLQGSDKFVQVHRSCVVNMEHISRIKDTTILLSTGREVSMARRMKTDVKKAFDNFIRKYARYL